MTSKWHCVQRNCNKVTPLARLQAQTHHPLKQISVTVFESKGTRRSSSSSAVNNKNCSSSATIALDPLSSALDPLSRMESEHKVDPLSRLLDKSDNMGSVNREVPLIEFMEPWSSRRAPILSKYTTTERLSIVTSFLTGGETIKSQTTMAEKVKHRLEQLDDFEEGSVRTMDVTQQEYVQKIEQLSNELVQAWNNDHRVTALKIAIQSSKLLADTSVLQFYPSQFVLITETLDTFGRLVYDRLKHKSGYIKPGTTTQTTLPDNFTPDMVPEAAKETCQNWFFKIASIRELLPRFYVEVAILRCYSFLTQTEFNEALLRLTKICRGIGDPLVAIYARCYLTRVGLTVTSDRQYLVENLDDFLAIYYTQFNNELKTELARQKIDHFRYLSLYTPALNWIMQGLAVRAPIDVLEAVFRKCISKKNNALLLHSMLSSFRPDFIAMHSTEFLNAVLKQEAPEDIIKFQLMKLLGASLVERSPPPDDRHAIIEGALKYITRLKSVADYMASIDTWAEFTAKHFKLKQINFILNDILSHMTPGRAFENHYPELLSVIDQIVSNVNDFEGLLTMDNFLPTIDLFQKESVKTEVCKNIMYIYRSKVETTTKDPVVINNLMFLCRILNDSVNALTGEDERRQISSLVSHFIKQVDYGRDFESQLSFYVSARSAFLNLDAVYSTLVYCVNRLAFDTRNLMKDKRHNKRTLAFVKGCIAYCYITIPSIQSIVGQMDLYYLTGGIALLNTCLGQADACFEAAILSIAELPPKVEIDGILKSTEVFLLSYIPRLLSVLILTPDSPDNRLLHLPNLLIEQLKLFSYDKKSTTLAALNLHILDMLTTASRAQYPFNIPGVISNDNLYGSDPKFLRELERMCDMSVDDILTNLGDLGPGRAQSTVALELFERIVVHSDVQVETQFMLATNLWGLALKSGGTSLNDPKLPQRIVRHLEWLVENDGERCQDLIGLIATIKRKL